LEQIKNFATTNSAVKYISFSKNFGQQVALKAGIDAMDVDAIIMMDTDMQHSPDLIPELLEIWQTKKVNMVNTIREEDEELGWFKKQSSKRFYALLNKISDLKLEPGQADFRLIDRKVAQTLRNSKEHDVFLRGMIQWIGFDQATLRYKAQKDLLVQVNILFQK